MTSDKCIAYVGNQRGSTRTKLIPVKAHGTLSLVENNSFIVSYTWMQLY